MAPFPDEDKASYPEMFRLPPGCYETKLPSPLGIAFEERTEGGVVVDYLVDGGAADQQGVIAAGDVLIAVTAVKVIGAKWERRLLPSLAFPFDAVVGAIGSNEKRWSCDDVFMQFMRPSDGPEMEPVKAHLDFFEPPSDSPWRH